MNFGNLKIGVRLAAGFGLVLLLLVVTTIMGIIKMNALNADTDALVNQNWVKAKFANQALIAVHGSAARVFEIVATTDAQQSSEAQQSLHTYTATFNDALSKLDGLLVTTEGRAQMAKTNEARDRYVAAYEKAVALAKAGDREGASKQAYGDASKELNDLADRLATQLDRQGKHFEETGAASVQTVASSRNQMTMLGCIAVLAGTVLAYLITRSITVPLAQAVQVAKTVAAGDLTSRIDAPHTDETGQLLAALRDMNDSLVKIVGEVRHSAVSMAASTSEIAAGNMDLSARTEAQAGSLEQTASAMEEITSTVKHNADNARQANQMALSASEIAAKGGAVVTEVVHTMNSINESSKKIVDIISVIDGIAFQTNILALNAAVEAARAGEQGRGFAVVAAEVRNLAQRSATAAKEIKELIVDSVEKVDAGSRLVGQAGSTMDEVVASIRRVTGIMGEMTTASSEQTIGIGQINTAINEMDNVTQKNAALVEQAAAAAGSLQEQAEGLTKVVSIFKLNDMRTMTTPKIAAPRPAPEVYGSAVKKISAARAAAPAKQAAKAPVKRIVNEAPAGDDWEQF